MDGRRLYDRLELGSDTAHPITLISVVLINWVSIVPSVRENGGRAALYSISCPRHDVITQECKQDEQA